MRLDRFLCEMNLGSRSQVKSFVRQGLVTVNGNVEKSPDRQVDEWSDEIACRGEALRYQKFVYYMMNKPAGVVSATSDGTEHTVVSLLGKDAKEGIFPVGRLDKDTTGLLLLTDDGGLAHRLLSPRKHVDKTYRVTIAHRLTEEDVRRLEEGLDIGEEKPTLPARVTLLEDTEIVEILLTLQEGKFHQVKRMLQAVDNQVLALKRVSFGGIALDEALQPGEYRPLTEEELDRLSGAGKAVRNTQANAGLPQTTEETADSAREAVGLPQTTEETTDSSREAVGLPQTTEETADSAREAVGLPQTTEETADSAREVAKLSQRTEETADSTREAAGLPQRTEETADSAREVAGLPQTTRKAVREAEILSQSKGLAAGEVAEDEA